MVHVESAAFFSPLWRMVLANKLSAEESAETLLEATEFWDCVLFRNLTGSGERKILHFLEWWY